MEERLGFVDKRGLTGTLAKERVLKGTLSTIVGKTRIQQVEDKQLPDRPRRERGEVGERYYRLHSGQQATTHWQ